MKAPNQRAGLGKLWFILALVPLAWIGPALSPGHVFLPQLPVQYEPLASEDPDAAERAHRDANWHASDRIFPLLATERTVAAYVRAGELPKWDPLSGTGAPLAGGSLSGTWYPPRWLGWLIGPERASAWLALFRLIAAGTGLALLLARLGYSRSAQIAGALALQLSGFAFANLHYGSKLDAALWLPWSLWAIEGLRRDKRYAGPMLAIATSLSFLAGFAPIAIFQTAAAGVRGLFAKRIESSKRVPKLALPLVIIAWIAVGIAGAGVEFGPTWDASLDSARSPQTAESMQAQALPLGALATLVQPDLIGDPTQAGFSPYPVAWWLTADPDKAGQANPLEWQTYIGVFVLALALAGLWAYPRRARIPAIALVTSLAFAFAWPPLTLLYEFPPFALGAPSRALAIAWICWPWLAALGFEALMNRRGLAIAGLVVIATWCCGILWSSWFSSESWPSALEQTLVERHGVTTERVHETFPRAALWMEAARISSASRLIGIALWLTLALACAARRRRATAALLIIGIAFEGIEPGHGHLRPQTTTAAEVFPASASMQALHEAAGDGRVLRLDTSESGVADVERLARPNLPMAYGIADLTPYTALPNRRTTELLEAIDPKSRYRTGASRLSTPAVLGHPVLDLLRVSAVLSAEPIEHPRLEPVLQRTDFHVYRRNDALPVARLVPQAIPSSNEYAALELWAQGSIDPTLATVLPPGVAARRAAAPFDPGTIVCDRPGPNRLDARVVSSSGGWLVFHETWDDGWKVTVDGQDAQLVRADWNARALFLMPGEHIVRTFYEPWSLRLGTLATILALATVLWRMRRARSCTSKSSPAEAAATPA